MPRRHISFYRAEKDKESPKHTATSNTIPGDNHCSNPRKVSSQQSLRSFHFLIISRIDPKFQFTLHEANGRWNQLVIKMGFHVGAPNLTRSAYPTMSNMHLIHITNITYGLVTGQINLTCNKISPVWVDPHNPFK